MPNNASAKKRLRQDAKRRTLNRAAKSTLRTELKQLDATIGEGDKEAAGKKLATTYKALDKAAAKGLIKKNEASRRKSRLTKKVNAVGKDNA